MSWRSNALLAFLGLALALGVAQFQHFPGYLDSDYYFGGGVQLANGKGFTEPYLWNYLDDPSGLPHPSHAYWMPLSSIIAAAGLWITGSRSYTAGRIGFLLLAALVPAATAALASRFTGRRELAMASGLLAVFSVYYVPFMPVTDNYGPYLLLGALYFLVMEWKRPVAYFGLGAIAGLLTLARSDGLLWLGLTAILIAARYLKERRMVTMMTTGLLALGGFLAIAGPWFWHTYSVYGTPLAPGGGHLLWLKNYDETFSYPVSQLTYGSWLAQGWKAILDARLMALRWNLLNAFAAQGEIFLLPFIVIGIWIYRKDERIRLAAFGWLCLLIVMSAIFPFAGARGGFFHSGAAFQSAWWVAAPVGLERVVAAARRRNMFTPQAFGIFRGALVGLAVLMTAVIVSIRVLPGWGEGEQNYPKVQEILQSNGLKPNDIVLVRNPPGYYLMTGQRAIVVPLGGESTMLAVASRYRAKYLVIEAAGASGAIENVYNNKASQLLPYLGEIDGTRIFRILP